jgi:hypothetical protein
MRVPWSIRFGIGLLAAAIGFSALALASWGPSNWRSPLNLPVSLKAGRIETPEFLTSRSIDYGISIEVERKIEFQRLKCLLGMDYYNEQERCAATPSLIDVSWVLSSGGNVITEGDSSKSPGGYFAGAVGRTIGQFRAEGGKRYSLELTLRKDASELDKGHPTIKVDILDPFEYKGRIVHAQLWGMAAMVSVVISLLFFAHYFFPQFLSSRENGNLT